MPTAALSTARAIGQLICPTLLHPASSYDEAAHLAALAEYGWGGYIVFHCERDTTRERLARLQAASDTPLLIAADMEHGAGQQVPGLSTFPSAMAFGAADDEALAHDLGAWTAREALGVGINWIFAPVADVTNNPLNPIINVRSYGGDPARVGRMVAAFTRGVQAHGALACAKHFPGHGDTSTDSHSKLGVIGADRARLGAIELPPFEAAIAADVASIMTAHLALPALGVHEPATVSPAVMTTLLRHELGFGGLVVTDALVMGGIVGSLDPLEAAVRAIAAGCDMLLMPPDPAATHAALLAAVQEGRLPEARVREAAGRVLAAKQRLAGPPAPAPTRTPHDVAAEVARRAVTLAKGPADLRLPAGTLAIAVDDNVEPERLDAWRQAVARHGLAAGPTVDPATSAADWAHLLASAETAPMVLVGVFSPIRPYKDRSLLPTGLVAGLRALAERRPTVLLSCSSPFVVAQLGEAAAWMLTYGSRPLQVEAAIAALCAGGPYPGHLPVELPAHLAPSSDGPSRPHGGPSFT